MICSVPPASEQETRDGKVQGHIRSGVLKPGARLPGTRALSSKLGVHRNTTLAAVAELRVRREYALRRDALVYELRRLLGSALSFRTPSGGLSLWARVEAPAVSSDAWAERALAQRVLVHPARRFRFDGREAPFLRLSFAPHTPEELRVAVARLARALPTTAPSARSTGGR